MSFRNLHREHQDLVAARDAWIVEDDDGANPRLPVRRPLLPRRDPFDFDDDVFFQLFRWVC